MEITGAGSGSGSGVALTVTDGITPVVNVTTINFTSGATVINGGGGQANVAIAGGSFAVMQPSSGVVNGVNKVFVWASAPSVIVLDNGTTMNKINIIPDLTVNWTGTTTTTLNVAPTFNIFGY